MLEDAGLSSRHADRQRLAFCHPKLDDIGPVALGAEDHDAVSAAFGRNAHRHRSFRRRSLGPLLGVQRCVGQALAPKVIAERLRNGGVGEAKSNIELLGLVPTAAAADWDASFTVERINL